MRIEVGDVFEVPLGDRSRAYGLLVWRHKHVGPLVEIYDLRLREGEPFSLTDLGDKRLLFPPVFAGVDAAVRAGAWKIVGHLPKRDFHFPTFLSADRGRDPFEIVCWHLWDGETYTRVGKHLPEEYEHLEMMIGWPAEDLAKRIETGVDHFRIRLREAK